jgi:ankyrin repeat protein
MSIPDWTCVIPYPPNIDSIDQIIKLIESGTDINAKYAAYEETILHHASRHNHMGIIKYLLSNGADISATDKFLNRPLHDAARGGNIFIIKLLLDNGADKCATNQSGSTAARIADTRGNYAAATYIDGYEYEPIPTKGVYLDG